MVTAGVALGSSAMGFRAWSAYVWLDPVSSDAIGLVAACASVKTVTRPGDICRDKAASRALGRAADNRAVCLLVVAKHAS